MKAADYPHQQVRRDGFVGTVDRTYLQAYAIENMTELIAREHLNQFDGYLRNQNEGRSERAQMIDMLFAVASSLKIEDKQIVY